MYQNLSKGFKGNASKKYKLCNQANLSVFTLLSLMWASYTQSASSNQTSTEIIVLYNFFLYLFSQSII